MIVKIPGKLMVMGEYAMMDSSSAGIIVAVDKFLTSEIIEDSNYGFNSQQGTFKWMLSEGIPVLRYDALNHVKAALNIVHHYLNYLNITSKPYHINMISELNHHDGKKYGLGSSGASMIAVIKSVLLFHGVKISNIKLFKLAVLAQLDIKDLTSGGELAASIYGGFVYYRRYDLLWVINHRGLSMKLIDMKWPGLEIEPLKVDNYKVLACFTGVSQSTKDYLDKVASKDLKSVWYKKFLSDAKNIVDEFKEALVNSNDLIVQNSIDKYRNLTLELQKWASIEIESEVFTKLIDTAKTCDFHAKVSGAGFGDCGIVITNKTNDEKELLKAWNQAGLMPLDLKVWEGNNVK